MRKLTEVAGRISSSKVRRAQFNPGSRVLHAATSSSSSASSPDSEVAAHEVHVSSRVWASPLVAPYNKAAPAPTSASWISGEAALAVSSGVTCS
jgi:hypothetical protein